MTALDVLRLLVGTGFLVYASSLDLRTRRVPNGVWLALGTLACLLFAADWFIDLRFGWIQVLIVTGGVLLAYGFWYFHIIPGGADAKALMALSILLPHSVEWEVAGQGLPLWGSFMPWVIVVLANSVILFSLAPLGLFVYNASRGDVRFPAMLLGYRRSLEHARASFVWVVDRVDAEGRIGQVLFPSRISDEDYQANLDRLQALGVQRVWVTPKIPFMVALLIGFVAAFVLGDVLFRLVVATVGALP